MHSKYIHCLLSFVILVKRSSKYHNHVCPTWGTVRDQTLGFQGAHKCKMRGKIDELDILSVSTSQESWEEKGVKTTYWLHKEYRLPLKRERTRKNKKSELIDVIEINIEKEDLDDELFEPPVKNTDYSISQSPKSETGSFFIPQKILGAEKKKVLFLFEETEENSTLKGVFSRYMSEEKDSYVYLVYFKEGIENKNFKIFKRALDLDMEGWSAVLPQTKEEWSVRILSNYPKPTLLKHLRVLWGGINPPVQEGK